MLLPLQNQKCTLMTQATLPSGHKRIDHAEMRGITKRFPGVLANDHVDFDVKRARFTRCSARTARANRR